MGKIKVQIISVGILLLGMIYIALSQHISLGQRYQKVFFNGDFVCNISQNIDAKQVEKEVRRSLAAENTDKLAMDYEMKTEEAREPFEMLSSQDELQELFAKQMENAVVQQGQKAYTVGIEGYRATFATLEEVLDFFTGVKAEADTYLQYEPVIKEREGHIQGIFTVELQPVVPNVWEEVVPESNTGDGVVSGVSASVGDALAYAVANPYKNVYQTGLLNLEFIEQIAIYEDYALPEEMADVAAEISEVTKEKETNKIYVVKSGDCLSLIAYELDTTVASIVALNGFKDANVIIDIDDELIVAVPEPDLMLRATRGEVYEEDYNAEPIIIPNDSWYTTKEVVHDPGTTGHRERNDIVIFENGIEVSREMIHENIMVESQPAVIERGTIIPPTYIKPINGGRFTSGYGKRWGRLHKGVDWAVPVGTKVFASSAGTVVRADYNGGYGLCVLIQHPDGKMTRYGHNSKLLVSKGQYVEQGETIALSGNTGRSTGPHVHFEIIVNGSAVNPLKYLN